MSPAWIIVVDSKPTVITAGIAEVVTKPESAAGRCESALVANWLARE